MNIFLINGSPKGKGSNSLKLAYSFIEGLKNGILHGWQEVRENNFLIITIVSSFV